MQCAVHLVMILLTMSPVLPGLGQSTVKYGGAPSGCDRDSSRLQKELEFVKNHLHLLKESLASCVNQMANHTHQYSTEMTLIKNHLDQCSLKLDQLEVVSNRSRDEINQVKDGLDQCKQDVSVLQQQHEDLQKKMEEAEINDQKNKQHAAFSAHDITSDHTVDVVKNYGDKLIFYQTTLNKGGHYNVHTGEFTCPVTGIYMFSVMLNSDNLNKDDGPYGPYADVKTEDGTLATVKMYSNNIGDVFAVLGGSVVTRCVVGKHVWVESTLGTTRFVSVNAEPANIFSGVLITPESSNP